jgi:cell division protein FtsB
LELTDAKSKIKTLQQFNAEMEEEIDNLKNELSTISENDGTNGNVRRASIEGLKYDALGNL